MMQNCSSLARVTLANAFVEFMLIGRLALSNKSQPKWHRSRTEPTFSSDDEKTQTKTI